MANRLCTITYNLSTNTSRQITRIDVTISNYSNPNNYDIRITYDSNTPSRSGISIQSNGSLYSYYGNASSASSIVSLYNYTNNNSIILHFIMFDTVSNNTAFYWCSLSTSGFSNSPLVNPGTNILFDIFDDFPSSNISLPELIT